VCPLRGTHKIEQYYGTINLNFITADAKIDQRFLFQNETDTLYVDACCHLNKKGMILIIDDLIVRAHKVFQESLK
jgi:hypothetical protein